MLNTDQKTSILDAFSNSRFPGTSSACRSAAAFIRLNAGLCWGASKKVRSSLEFTPYQPEPEPDIYDNSGYAEQHIPYLEKGETLPQQQKSFDYVIVGSGPGGSAAAYELCKIAAEKSEQITIAIVEKGEWRQPGQLAQSALGAVQSLLDNQGMTIASPEIASEKVPPQWPVVHANAVGGTSVINSAICHRTPKDILDAWFAKDPDEKDRFIEYLDSLNNTMPTQSTDASMPPDSFDRKIHQAAKATYDGDNHNQNCGGTDGEIRKFKFLCRYTSGCEAKNSCFRGCPTGAKQSVDSSLLLEALETKVSGANVVTILSNAHVTAIDFEHYTGRKKDIAKGVKGSFIHPKSKKEGASFTIQAKRGVIIAASAVISPLLLKTSIKKHLPDLGKHFQSHPGSNIIGIYDEELYKLDHGHINAVTQGWASTYYRDRNEKDHTGFKLETLAAPLDLFSGRIPLSGTELMFHLKRWKNMGVIVQACRAKTWGTVHGTMRNPEVTYKLSKSEIKRFRQGIYEAARLHAAAGATHIMHGIAGLEPILPVAEIDKIKRASTSAASYQAALTHLFGGCIMGTNAINSVCDIKGKVHRHEKLYIVDASVLPSNIGVNPQQTIMANAMRIAKHITSETF